MTIAALGGALVGQFHDGTSLTMTLAIGLSGVLALLVYRGLVVQRTGAIKASEPSSPGR